MMHANNREDIKVARTGDIIAVAGLKDVITGETLCDEKKPIMLERMEFPGFSPGELGFALRWKPFDRCGYLVWAARSGGPVSVKDARHDSLDSDCADPVIKIAIEPKSKSDLEKMSNGLIKLAQEDPSFNFSRDDETNQTVIEGMGELHLDIIVDRLRREYKVCAAACDSHKPPIYRSGHSFSLLNRDKLIILWTASNTTI